MNTYIENDNSDVTIVNMPEAYNFQANVWAMQPNLWYPVMKFLSFTEDYYNGVTAAENPLNLFIKLHVGNMVVDGVPDQLGTLTAIYEAPFYGLTNVDLEFSLVNLGSSSNSKFTVFRTGSGKNEDTSPTGELSFRFGFYEGVLHLFVRNNTASNIFKNIPITVKRFDRVGLDEWFSLENHIKIFGAYMMMNIVEDLSTATENITFIDSVIIPKVMPFQLRADLDYTPTSYIDQTIQGASHAYDFPDENHAVYYFGNRHAYHGLFVGKLHRLVDRSASPRFIGTTAQRPDVADIGDGFEYFDTTLKQLIVKSGTGWVDPDGYLAGISKIGTFAARPSAAPLGYMYLCTDKQTQEGQVQGIPIWHRGSDSWCDALGRTIS